MKGKRDLIGIRYALSGLLAVYKLEKNFRFHVLAVILVIGLGFILQLSLLEWGSIVIVISIVLITEMINTVIEELIDYVKPEIHEKARYIKDAAAGAVLVSAIGAVIVGVIVFLPKLIGLFSL